MSVLSEFSSAWSSVYKHNGGLPSLARCLKGTAGILLMPAQQKIMGKVEAITFSVIPELTLAWHEFIGDILHGTAHKITIGDCSGGYRYMHSNGTSVQPIYNFLHGRKLDYFMRKVCTAEYIVVSDDDIIWTSTEPLTYALQKFETDPDCAVVSLKPREVTSSLLAQIAPVPMGSYCIVIRRSIWLEQNLSFQITDAPRDRDYEWFYDTADNANKILIERGFTVDIAPDFVRSSLVTIEGASTWTLKIHKYGGRILSLIQNIPIRQEKAYRVILFLEGIGRLLAEHFSDDNLRSIIEPDAAKRAQETCLSLLSEDDAMAIRSEVRTKIEIIGKRLREIRVAR